MGDQDTTYCTKSFVRCTCYLHADAPGILCSSRPRNELRCLPRKHHARPALSRFVYRIQQIVQRLNIT